MIVPRCDLMLVDELETNLFLVIEIQGLTAALSYVRKHNTGRNGRKNVRVGRMTWVMLGFLFR